MCLSAPYQQTCSLCSHQARLCRPIMSEAKSSMVMPHVVQVSDTFCPDDAECEVVIGLIVHIRPHPYGFWLSPSTVAYSVLTAFTSSSFQVSPAC